MSRRVTSKTDANLQVALAGEADANRRYIAYGFQALNEGRPEIAQLFFEAAGAETVHALTHLKTMGAVGSTRENLERAATGEMEEIDVVLPRMIRDAEQEGRADAAASFRLALERERHHRDMFRAALAAFDGGAREAGPAFAKSAPPVPSTGPTSTPPGASGGAAAADADPGASPGEPAPPARETGARSRETSATGPEPAAQDPRLATRETHAAAHEASGAAREAAAAAREVSAAAREAPASVALGAAATAMLRTDGRSHGHGAELTSEPGRIERLSSIREVVFGAQDGLVSTFAVVAGLAAAGADHLIVLLAGAVSAAAGVLSMSVGTFLSSRAQRQVYEAELTRERREILDHPGEEVAELVASLMGRGMSRADAVEVGRRIARHPDLLLETLAAFELGLAPQRLGTPVRDAFVMAAAFAVGGTVPLVPFALSDVMLALGLAALATVIALFSLGAMKGRFAHVSPLRSGLEVVALGLGSGLIGFGLGRLASVVLGVEIG